MKKKYKLSLSIVVIGLLGSTGQVCAERGDATSQQQDMKQMMEMLKKQGMDEKTQEQMENMFKGMGQKMDKRQAAQTKIEQQQFESATVGHGIAIVEVEGKRYDLTVTKCELWGGGTGKFNIEARQPPVKGAWKLTMGADKRTRVGLTFQAGRKGYWREQAGSPDKTSSLRIKENGIQWNGLVGEGENIPATIQVTCGAEMQNYAKPAMSPKNIPPHVLTLSLGDETHPFQIGYCSTKAYRTGNLMVEFDATATGTFRGRPAIILLSKSHSIDDQPGKFEEMTLLLGELTNEQRAFSPWKINQEHNEKINAFSSKANLAIQKKYEKKMAAIQEKYGKDIPPEKMSEVMDVMNKASDVQGQEMDKVEEQVKAMRFPEARSNGTVSINGKEGLFRGPKFRVLHGKNVSEFKNLEDRPEVQLNCGK